MTVPYWVEDAVFYQIFPDRFFNGDKSNDLPNFQDWDSAPTTHGFQGGDLRGIIARFDYLLDLGITGIYLNPIFQATSNHRYNISDYYKIDPKLGTLADFKALLEIAHQNQVRIILDGVFNHCGRGFFAFNDILENQDRSLYKSWFHVLRIPVDAYSPGDAQDYLAWWKYKSLPKFNTTNPAVRKYILDVARYWIDLGADGWRLDVPNEIDDDAFWADFRRVVKQANPEAYLVGEIWDAQRRWVGDDHFDGLMNYPFRESILGLLSSKLTSLEFSENLEKIINTYPRENTFAMYVPMGSHDTERLQTALGSDQARVNLAFMLQFALPGAPAVYYGDEIGLDGGKDPACRRTFPWNKNQWNSSLREYVQKLIFLRKRNVALRRGNFIRLACGDGKGCATFARVLGQEKVLIVVNPGSARRTARISVSALGLADGQILHNLLGSGEFIVAGDQLTVSLPGWSGMWLA